MSEKKYIEKNNKRYYIHKRESVEERIEKEKKRAYAKGYADGFIDGKFSNEKNSSET